MIKEKEDMQDDITQTIGIMPCLDMKEGRVVKGIHFVEKGFILWT
jgi:hypothetical protein